MNFNRSRFQSNLEVIMGCSPASLREADTVRQVESYRLTRENITSLGPELIEDAKDFYFKASMSLMEAISGISRGQYSWSVVKSYYSVFYSARAYLAAHHVGIFRAKRMYSLTLKPDEALSRLNGQGDHSTMLKAFKRFFPDIDILSNDVDGETPVFDFLQEQRNLVNYRERGFVEPSFDYFYEPLKFDSSFTESLDMYFADSSLVYCFNSAHCNLAFPIKMLQKLKHSIVQTSDSAILPAERRGVLHRLRQQSNLDEESQVVEIINV